jgi:hypothetical protein
MRPLISLALVFSLVLNVVAQDPRSPLIYKDRRLEADPASVDGSSHNGKEVQVDLPASLHIKNFGAPEDGLGLCVFATMSMMARWHNIPELSDVIHKLKQGGGWPGKVAKVVKEFAPEIEIVQYEGDDLSGIEKALSEGKAVGVTYGYGERYQMQTISHMVLMAYLDEEDAAILDSNFPGTYEWMSRKEFLRRFVHPGGKGWMWIFVFPGPPPVPHN